MIVKNWRKILRRAWSVRFMLLAALLTGAEAVLPFFTPLQPSPLWALSTFAIVVGAFVARFVAQDIED